jgi:hypothetical protein
MHNCVILMLLYGLNCICLLQKHGTTSKPLKPARLDSEVIIKHQNYVMLANYHLQY